MASQSEMTPKERDDRLQEEFKIGPLSLLTESVKNNTQVLINCRYGWLYSSRNIIFRTPKATYILEKQSDETYFLPVIE